MGRSWTLNVVSLVPLSWRSFSFIGRLDWLKTSLSKNLSVMVSLNANSDGESNWNQNEEDGYHFITINILLSIPFACSFVVLSLFLTILFIFIKVGCFIRILIPNVMNFTLTLRYTSSVNGRWPYFLLRGCEFSWTIFIQFLVALIIERIGWIFIVNGIITISFNRLTITLGVSGIFMETLEHPSISVRLYAAFWLTHGILSAELINFGRS